MKLKFFACTCIIAILLACMAPAVAASSVNVADTAETGAEVATVVTGDTVTATIDFGSAVVCGEFHITYNASVLQLVTETPNLPGVQKIASSTDGNVGYVFAGSDPQAVSSFTLEFKAIGEVGKTDTIAFVPAEGEFRGVNSAAAEVTGSSKGVEVIAATNVPEEKDPADKKDDTSKADDKKEEGKTPTKYPQTGVNVAYVACGVALVLAAGYIVVKKH